VVDISPTEKLLKNRGFGVFLLVWSGVGGGNRNRGVHRDFQGIFLKNFPG